MGKTITRADIDVHRSSLITLLTKFLHAIDYACQEMALPQGPQGQRRFVCRSCSGYVDAPDTNMKLEAMMGMSHRSYCPFGNLWDAVNDAEFSIKELYILEAPEKRHEDVQASNRFDIELEATDVP